MRIGSERLVGSRAIMRRLDELVPEPALLPAPGDPARERVLEIERWGDEVFQSVARRMIDAAFIREPRAMESYARRRQAAVARCLDAAGDAAHRAPDGDPQQGQRRRGATDIAALPGQLAQLDAWISEGLLGDEPPNAADLQVGSTIRLLRSIGDVRAIVDEHAAARLARYFPPLSGQVDPGALPSAWLPAITIE